MGKRTTACGESGLFSSKANTLLYLSAFPELNIPEFLSFTVAQWNASADSVLQTIKSAFNGNLMAIRSSCLREDSTLASGAGSFLSVLHVDPANRAAMKDAIERVIASYGMATPDDQFFAQVMIHDIAVSGVIMTRALTDGTPYYVINYDDESGKTDTITGGRSVSKTVYVYRDVRDDDFDSSRLRSFVQLARRVEEICGCTTLDMEFCLDRGNKLHLLQARPICAQAAWPEAAGSVSSYIRHVSDFVADRTSRNEGLYGQSSILGVMPDWNPAEMIGVFPHPLDISLYRDLITARVWSSARARMGYHPVPSMELMVACAGRPYIDVRASFNSFLPAGLDPVSSEALVSAWLEMLASNPHLHDKVEFEVAITSMDFCFDEHLEARYPGLLTSSRKEAFRKALASLTGKCLGPNSSLYMAMERITELRARHAGRPLLESRHPITAVNGLLAECRKFGTLPFAILARHSFIAESLLKTAVIRGALDSERVAAFKRSIRTISGELSHDFRQVCAGNRDGRSFINKYGHLRPCSYDILSPRYADRANLFHGGDLAYGNSPPAFVLASSEKEALEKLLAESGLPGNAANLLRYAELAIAGRELAKFVFSRNLSDVLETIAAWAENMGFSREEAAFIPIQPILDIDYAIGVDAPRDFFADIIARNREAYEKCRHIKLGYLIRSESDIYIVPQHRSAPNFIGNRAVAADVVRLYPDSACDVDLNGKIVCIENADPGFDWIFTRGIGGLVTKFGGANSHMAIRCAEYGLPAAIGVGEKLFADIGTAPDAHLDPANAVLRVKSS